MRITPKLDERFFEQGFNEGTDIFELRDLAERLTSLFEALEHGTVSILDGRWGTGKSVFAQQWAHHLTARGTPAIYFDAFSKDYIQDPFLAVSSSFIKAAIDERKTDTATYERFLGAAAAATKKIGSTAAKVGTKVLTLGIIGSAELEQLSVIKDDIASALGDLSEESVRKYLEEVSGAEEVFATFRKSLEDLPDLLAHTDSVEGAQNRLVVIIDELDRCRPDFALGILETLKHFFRVNRIHFVLVTNRSHLLLSVHKRYGVGDMAEEYIQKFYDFIIPFEQKREDHKGPRSKTYVSRLVMSLIPSGIDGRRDIQGTLESIASAFDLTLRQVESIVTNVALAHLSVRSGEFRPTNMICFLCSIKTLWPELYKRAKMGTLLYGDARAALVTGKWGGNFNIEHVLNVFQYHLDPDANMNEERFKHFGGGLATFNFSTRLDIIPYVCNGIIDRFVLPGASNG